LIFYFAGGFVAMMTQTLMTLAYRAVVSYLRQGRCRRLPTSRLRDVPVQ
jgi:hypothetical protein